METENVRLPEPELAIAIAAGGGSIVCDEVAENCNDAGDTASTGAPEFARLFSHPETPIAKIAAATSIQHDARRFIGALFEFPLTAVIAEAVERTPTAYDDSSAV